jgi:hypothetical protein
MSIPDKTPAPDKVNISKRKIIIASTVILFCIISVSAAILISGLSKKQFPDKAPYDAVVSIDGQTINIIKVAKTPAEQSQGLSNHAPLMENEGMLFEFKDKQIRQFWMKDMLFPLDIIWINDSRIINISKNLPPEGPNPTKIYSSMTPADTVLEINAGLSDKYGFKADDQISIGLPL